MSMNNARILIAQTPETAPITQFALVGYELVTVYDLKAAKYQVMENGIDLFVVGIHFDESRATDLIAFIREDEKHKRTPVLVVRLLASTQAYVLTIKMNALIRIEAVQQYLEIAGSPNASKKIRAAVDALLPVEKLMSK
jgi:hypothetical protein